MAETGCVYGDCLPTLAHSPPFVRGVRLHAFDKRFIFAEMPSGTTRRRDYFGVGEGSVAREPPEAYQDGVGFVLCGWVGGEGADGAGAPSRR